ncbi:MAG: HAD family phosphatase [Deltaproteobacteria bacterium]|jgi:HAD superfamily hydrolase (TIGR01509 family)|nr:HAD family phosphatase [Deltaproteobacteria bacterium]MBW2531822.1 HAD family phosphatase [Deltaproteobacteria bacterium]
MAFRSIEAVLFDMDGTLIDSEGLTEVAVGKVLTDRGLATELVDFSRFHGITWAATVVSLRKTFPELGSVPLSDVLMRAYQDLFVADFPPLIEGARDAVRQAAEHRPTGIVTSSSRMTVEHVVEKLELGSILQTIVCAEDCARSKPDPEGYLLAAERLDVSPSRCLVFEDSLVGLRAAKLAGMKVVAISHGASPAVLAEQRQIADDEVPSFAALPRGFFASISRSERP